MSTIVGDGTSKPTVTAALSEDDPDVVSVLGDARFAPTAVRLLQEQPAMNMDQLRNLGRVLEKCAAAGIDFDVLTKELRAMTDERNASQCSQTLSGSAKTPKSSSRDSSPDVPLAHLRRLINTSAADPVEESSAHESDCASQDHASRDRASRDHASQDHASRDRASRNPSPDTPLGDTTRHSGDACTLDKVLALNKAVANTLPPAAVIATTSTDLVTREDAPAEPDFFQELLDANVEPMSADELQSAQDIMEASSIATATVVPKTQPSTIQASLKRALPQRLMWQPLPQFPGNVRPFAISSPPRPDIRSSGSISAVSPRTVMPTLRPPPPPPDHARGISADRVPPSLSLRSNAPAHASSAQTFPVLVSALPGPSTTQRQSYGHASGASQLTWMGMPRRSVAIPHTAPPLRASSDVDQEVHRESSVSRQGSVAGGLSDREKTMLTQQFVDTGGMGGLRLVLPPWVMRSA
ncbi:hypothetical protein DOTSEDRAFT_75701 [Dothistroma septosporum NZE10]|uniref:DUF7071 domain-containing protein n=1 Tax=Dothistroma septosporum (strain NZE10 / CBS 128990) TaxID=675120 RepID=N1PCS9_DOTSN|nr:hypothetical protein DOTSEDRAFT_75701 [Dothistroma septosporum NZE10]